MKKRKLMLSVLLSAAMTASCITPAFAGELSSGEENGLVSEEIMEIIPENIPGTEEPQTESAETEIPEVETPEVEIPEEEMPEAETPEVETPEVETPEQEVLPFEELGDGFQEGQAAESGTSVNAVSSAVHAEGDGKYTDYVFPYEDAETKDKGIFISTFETGKAEGNPYRILYWDMKNGGLWSPCETAEGKVWIPEEGVQYLYGTKKWNLHVSDKKGTGVGGYIINTANKTAAYYLTAEDVKNPSVLQETFQSQSDVQIPAELFVGAEGNINNHAGLQTINGKKYYIEKDGALLTDSQCTVDGVIYFFDKDGVCYKTSEEKKEAGWVQSDDGNYYWMQEDGTFLREGGWHELDGKMYFLNYGSGRRRTGWITWSKRKFYIEPESLEILTGMQEIDGKPYYFDPESKPVGKMVVGWKTLKDGKYYFDKNGVRKKGWLTLGERKYYFEKSGPMKKGWRSIGGKKYYFDQKNGYMRKGWTTIGSDKYYMNKDGSLHTGWRSLGGKKYYFVPKTGKMKKGWLTLNNKKYYFEKDGHQTFGWRSVGGKVYYFMPLPNSGYMRTGWLTVGEDKYYMNLDGSRCTGLKKITGKNYYFESNGKMVRNKRAYSINGKRYNISENGVVMEMSKAEHLAAERLDQIGWDLYSAFKWASSAIDYYRHDFVVPDGYKNPSDYYAEYGFTTGRGNCYIMAGTFYHMARLLGYEVHQVNGSVPLAAGGMGPHSWVEIVVNGSTYVCDPDFTYDSGRNGYMIHYKQPGTWMYMNYHRIN